MCIMERVSIIHSKYAIGIEAESDVGIILTQACSNERPHMTEM